MTGSGTVSGLAFQCKSVIVEMLDTLRVIYTYCFQFWSSIETSRIDRVSASWHCNGVAGAMDCHAAC